MQNASTNAYPTVEEGAAERKRKLVLSCGKLGKLLPGHGKILYNPYQHKLSAKRCQSKLWERALDSRPKQGTINVVREVVNARATEEATYI